MPRIALAAVAGAHGIKGELKLKLFGSADSLAAQKRIFIGGREVKLTSFRAAGKGAIARLDGVDDRSTAEALRGSLLEVDRASLPPLAEDEYYHTDLIGLAAVSTDGVSLGTVVAVENFGAGDVIEIERPTGKRFMVPMNAEAVPEWGDTVLVNADFAAAD